MHPTMQIAQPLDKKSIGRVYKNAKTSDVDPRHFFYADFPMGYDPYTCVLDEFMELKVSFQTVQLQTLELYGRSWAIDGTLSDI